MNYRLQQYEDGAFGYLNIDGNNYNNFETESKVLCTQGEDEDRDEFINKNNITFQTNQYGSNLKLDMQINDEDWNVRKAIAEQGYGLDKLVNDENEYVHNAATKYLKTHNKSAKVNIDDLLKLDIEDFINAVNRLDKDELNELKIYADEINDKCEKDSSYSLLNSKLVIWLNEDNEILSFDDVKNNNNCVVMIGEPDGVGIKIYYVSSKSILSIKLIKSIFDEYVKSNHWCKLVPGYSRWQTMYFKGSFKDFADFCVDDFDAVDDEYKQYNDDAISNIRLKDIIDTNKFDEILYQKVRANCEENYTIYEY